MAKTKIQDKIDAAHLEKRTVFLWGQVDDKSAKHVVDRLMYLDSLNNEEIKLIINSPGGYVTSGFAIHDAMKAIKSPVSTICTGFAASMGSILLSAGEKGKRDPACRARHLECGARRLPAGRHRQAGGRWQGAGHAPGGFTGTTLSCWLGRQRLT